MNAFIYRSVASVFLLTVLSPVAGVNAQAQDLVKPPPTTGQTGGLGNLGGVGGALSGQSLSAGSTGNVAGLLEFCIQNNYLGGKDAPAIKDKIMGKLPGGSVSSDSGYTDGTKGLLKSSDGKQLDLSGGGLKAQVSSRSATRFSRKRNRCSNHSLRIAAGAARIVPGLSRSGSVVLSLPAGALRARFRVSRS